MRCRKKGILLVISIILVITASSTLYFGNLSSNKPVIYQPREVKINGVHLADT